MGIGAETRDRTLRCKIMEKKVVAVDLRFIIELWPWELEVRIVTFIQNMSYCCIALRIALLMDTKVDKTSEKRDLPRSND